MAFRVFRVAVGVALDCKVAVLPCGHYSCGEAPFKYMDAWHMARFLDQEL